MTADELKGRAIDAIVIGASAGGVEALSVVLPALPADLRACVLVVLHLPRDRASLLTSIFEYRCVLPVGEAEDKAPLRPGTVTFAPPDYHLLVDRGPRVSLSSDELVNFSRPSIDVLFESAADAFESRVLAVVLTGGNSDGAAGLQAIRDAGGVTVVQEPSTAQASLMPASALERGPADFVLPLNEIAALFKTLGSNMQASSSRAATQG